MNCYLVAQKHPTNCGYTGAQFFTGEYGIPTTEAEALAICEDMIAVHGNSRGQLELWITEFRDDYSCAVDVTDRLLGMMCADFWHDECSEDASGIDAFCNRFGCIEKHWPPEVHKLASALYIRSREMAAE